MFQNLYGSYWLTIRSSDTEHLPMFTIPCMPAAVDVYNIVIAPSCCNSQTCKE